MGYFFSHFSPVNRFYTYYVGIYLVQPDFKNSLQFGNKVLQVLRENTLCALLEEIDEGRPSVRLDARCGVVIEDYEESRDYLGEIRKGFTISTQDFAFICIRCHCNSVKLNARILFQCTSYVTRQAAKACVNNHCKQRYVTT